MVGRRSRKLAELLGLTAAGVSFLIALVGAGYTVAKIQFPGKPALEAVPSQIDFGSVNEGVQEARFEIVNRSSSPIEILRVEKDCSCETAAVPAGTLAPSERAVAYCQWDTRGRSGPSVGTLGIVYRVAAGEGEKTLIVEMIGTIHPRYRFEPSPYFTEGIEETRVIRLVPDAMPDAKIISVSCRNPAFVVERREDGSAFSIRFTPSKWSDRSGHVDVVVQTNDSEAPFQLIPVQVMRAPPKQP